MPATQACPDETELLAMAMGEPVAAALTEHVAGCARCRATCDRLQAEVAMLRDNRRKAPRSSSTLNEPIPQSADTDVQIDDLGATVTRQSSDLAGDPVSITRTDPVNDDAGSSSRGCTVAGRDREIPGHRPVSPHRAGGGLPGRPPRACPGAGAQARARAGPARRPLRDHRGGEDPGSAGPSQPGPSLRSDFHDDRPYLVMEYIRGRTLDQLAREGRLKPRRAAALLAKVAGAAEHAHRQGIFHRDIKPKNILVDESGEPRLIDFGMARLCHAYADDPGQSGGTFAFMAPEQARIESPEEQQKVGPRSDVFALGAVLYDLLTGEAPFPGRNWRESMDRARRCDFDRKALDDPRVPRDLRGICLKAMAADPADRYPSAEALQKALNRFVDRPKIRARGRCRGWDRSSSEALSLRTDPAAAGPRAFAKSRPW